MKRVTRPLVLSILALAFNSASANSVCNDINNYTASSASLIPVSCTDPIFNVLNDLNKSGQFSDVKFIGVCYVTDPNNPIFVNIGSTPVTLQTMSNWTNSFETFGIPYIFQNMFPNTTATGTIGTVATQITVTGRNGNNKIGMLHTRDTINLATVPVIEDDIIIHGTGLLQGAKGTLTISSVLNYSTGVVEITSVKGRICQGK